MVLGLALQHGAVRQGQCPCDPVVGAALEITAPDGHGDLERQALLDVDGCNPAGQSRLKCIRLRPERTGHKLISSPAPVEAVLRFFPGLCIFFNLGTPDPQFVSSAAAHGVGDGFRNAADHFITRVEAGGFIYLPQIIHIHHENGIFHQCGLIPHMFGDVRDLAVTVMPVRDVAEYIRVG